METLVKEEDIEICKSCNAEANPKKQSYDWICSECGRDEDTFQYAVKQTITRKLLKK